MRILALVPARSGSKRLPNKNIKSLGGKPLISWTINSARQIPDICEILVSTDSQKIASIAKSEGALVPWKRPKELATDEAKTFDVAMHALNWYEENNEPIDGLMILQPTSPFRSKETIINAIRMFESTNFETIIGVSMVQNNPEWMFRIGEKNQRLTPFLPSNGLNKRSQDLSTLYVPNGSLYLIHPSVLRKDKTLFPEIMNGLVLESEIEALDIDTKSDLIFARYLLQKKENKFLNL